MKIEQGFNVVSQAYAKKAQRQLVQAAELSAAGQLDQAQNASLQGQRSLDKAVLTKELYAEVAQEIQQIDKDSEIKTGAPAPVSFEAGRPLLEALITSRLRLEVLSTMVTQPDTPMQLSELSRRVNSTPATIQDEIAYLLKNGLLNSYKEGNKRLLEIKSDSPFYPLLSMLLGSGLDDTKSNIQPGLETQGVQPSNTLPPAQLTEPATVDASLEEIQSGVIYPQREERFITSPAREVLYVTGSEDEGEVRDPNDITPTEEKLLLTVMEIDDERKGFKLASWKEIYREVFAEELVGLDEEKKKHVEKNSISRKGRKAKESLIRKLKNIETVVDVPKYIGVAVLELKSIAEYAHITNEDILAILEERMNFEDVLAKYRGARPEGITPASTPTADHSGASLSSLEEEVAETYATIEPDVEASISEGERTQTTIEEELPDSLELSKVDTYLLATILGNHDARVRGGIDLHPEDREEIKRIMEVLGQDPEIAKNLSIDASSLISKLVAYLRDRRGVFLANTANEDAQFLLTPLATLSSEEQIMALVGPQETNDVKKNGNYLQALQ